MYNNDQSNSVVKKVITITLITLVVVGLAYFLFKISPEQSLNTGTGYNASLNTRDIKKLASVPPFNPMVDRFLGNPNSKNVFIEYADFQCPGCASYSKIVKNVPTEFTDTVFVYRYFPLINIHKNATIAALAAEAAGEQGKYWDMHDTLFEKQSEWENIADPLVMFAGYASSIGVKDIEQFKNDITNKKNIEKIESGFREAMGLSLPGTPSFIFNGQSIKPDSLEAMKKQSLQYLVK